MSDTSAIDAATRRLTLALDALEAAAEGRREAELGKSELAAQIHALDDDRSRLASDLDNAVAQGRSLENANREIAKRLDTAMDSIRSVLEAHDS
jgi:enoyl reductase-like protein